MAGAATCEEHDYSNAGQHQHDRTDSEPPKPSAAVAQAIHADR